MFITSKLTVTTFGRSIIPAWSRRPCSTPTSLVINILAWVEHNGMNQLNHLFNVHNFTHEICGIESSNSSVGLLRCLHSNKPKTTRLPGMGIIHDGSFFNLKLKIRCQKKCMRGFTIFLTRPIFKNAASRSRVSTL